MIGLHRGPALDGRGVEMVGRNKVVEHDPEARHLNELRGWNCRGIGVRFDLIELAGDADIFFTELRGSAENFGKIDGGDADAVALENFFGVAHGIECTRPSADGAKTNFAQALYHPTHRNEIDQVGAKRRIKRTHDVFCRQRVGDSRLAQVVAD
jgi:hypothetical protein